MASASGGTRARRSSGAATQVNEAKGPAGLGEVRKAYEYSADRIGQGAGAGPLWAEYLAFLQVRRRAERAAGPSVASRSAAVLSAVVASTAQRELLPQQTAGLEI